MARDGTFLAKSLLTLILSKGPKLTLSVFFTFFFALQISLAVEKLRSSIAKFRWSLKRWFMKPFIFVSSCKATALYRLHQCIRGIDLNWILPAFKPRFRFIFCSWLGHEVSEYWESLWNLIRISDRAISGFLSC